MVWQFVSEWNDDCLRVSYPPWGFCICYKSINGGDLVFTNDHMLAMFNNCLVNPYIQENGSSVLCDLQHLGHQLSYKYIKPSRHDRACNVTSVTIMRRVA